MKVNVMHIKIEFVNFEIITLEIVRMYNLSASSKFIPILFLLQLNTFVKFVFC